tara:strand:- start:181 stop:384 length:204 start_codon:yes stop_codon:yes gene_type:complete
VICGIAVLTLCALPLVYYVVARIRESYILAEQKKRLLFEIEQKRELLENLEKLKVKAARRRKVKKKT